MTAGPALSGLVRDKKSPKRDLLSARRKNSHAWVTRREPSGRARGTARKISSRREGRDPRFLEICRRGGSREDENSPRGSVNATLKSAYKSLRRRFPAGSGAREWTSAPVFAPPPNADRTRVFLISCATRGQPRPSAFGGRRDAFCNRCASALSRLPRPPPFSAYNHPRMLP